MSARRSGRVSGAKLRLSTANFLSSWSLACGVLLAGCPDYDLAALAPCTQGVERASNTQRGPNQVDLLFVVDNSGSMAEEQATLGKELPRLVKVLTSGDLEGDGEQDFKPVDLHFGVVSTDLGAANIGDSCGAR